MVLRTVAPVAWMQALALALALADAVAAGATPTPTPAPAAAHGAGQLARTRGLPSTHARTPRVPHLTGIFVSLDNTTSARTVAEWTADLQAMKDVGIAWFALRATAAPAPAPATTPPPPPHAPARAPAAAPPTATCALGHFVAYYPVADAPGSWRACSTQAHAGVDTVGRVLEAARGVGLGVHLGLAYTSTNSPPAGMSSTAWFRAVASMNWGIAQQLWRLYGQRCV